MKIKQKIALIAFGGNAILPSHQRGLQIEQMRNSTKAAKLMIEIVKKGYELIIVHGNGPQVGNILIQMEEASNKIPPFTLDLCGAMTEGSMGYMLEKALINELRRQSIDKEVVTVLTQVVVDRDDEAFKNPTKPIGPFYTHYRAQILAREKRWIMVEDSGRGWRKVVPSPMPIDVIPHRIIRGLILEGRIVISAGGGGIPVFINKRGMLEGVEAVIDKDYAASLLAREVGVHLFIILTSIDQVFLDYGKETQREIDIMRVSEAKKYLEEGQFPEGSMGPKIRAAIQFIEGGGKEVLITSANKLRASLINRAGTRIIQ
ncbi:MAG: carbamate kinase [Acidobacteriota bacterium]